MPLFEELIEHLCTLPDQFIGRIDAYVEGSSRAVAGERFDLFYGHSLGYPASDAGMATIVACSSVGKNLYLKAFCTITEVFYIRQVAMVGMLIVGEAPTMRNPSPSKLAKVLVMNGVFFRSFG